MVTDAEICCPVHPPSSTAPQCGGVPPITPSWAGGLSPGTLRAWGRARNLGVEAGALVLLGTACLPPSGLLKSLEDSGKLLGKESTRPCLVLTERLEPKVGVASTSKSGGRAGTRGSMACPQESTRALSSRSPR